MMHGPNGEEVENVGVFLDVGPGRRLVTTDVFRPGWIPNGRAFTVAEILLEAVGEGRRSAGGPRQVDLAQESGRLTMEKAPKVRTCLWFDDQPLPTAEFYCALFPRSRIDRVARYPEGAQAVGPGKVLLVECTLAGTPYQTLNGGPHFELDEAVSISVQTEDQAETDRLWEALISGAAAEGPCGWLKDRFGLSGQIVPKQLGGLMGRSGVWPASMKMKKIDIAALEAALG